MTEWIHMTKPGIDGTPPVTREAFDHHHAGSGWVEYTPPAIDPDESDGTSSNESAEDTETTTRTSRRAAPQKEQ